MTYCNSSLSVSASIDFLECEESCRFIFVSLLPSTMHGPGSRVIASSCPSLRNFRKGTPPGQVQLCRHKGRSASTWRQDILALEGRGSLEGTAQQVELYFTSHSSWPLGTLSCPEVMTVCHRQAFGLVRKCLLNEWVNEQVNGWHISSWIPFPSQPWLNQGSDLMAAWYTNPEPNHYLGQIFFTCNDAAKGIFPSLTPSQSSYEDDGSSVTAFEQMPSGGPDPCGGTSTQSWIGPPGWTRWSLLSAWLRLRAGPWAPEPWSLRCAQRNRLPPPAPGWSPSSGRERTSLG